MISSTPVGAEGFERVLEDCKTADSEADLTGVKNSLVLLLLNELLDEKLDCLGDISKLFNDTELLSTWVKFLSYKLNKYVKLLNKLLLIIINQI